jgi:chemotaxis receptor (MCP) glutamine deamidase CheD
MPIILAGNFTVNVKDNCNAELVEFTNDSFELDVLSDVSQGTTRSGSCIDMVCRRNVDNLSCMNYVLYFSNQQSASSSTHWHNYKLNALGNFNK